ncbi:tRNA pseudouridine(55) synthase [Aphanomyces invadans]|uniref:tRNA pseudouridine(55) synthase n=1 Tax=Aphanomyces invadans TaxID=157072 RepID=A0A024T8Y4_9STRA|nr:tRNA pseudouridine(55) synthase [Aphanomyces invadans]ETV90424.1 tRNA pseudouridine(55) synthase [Aphanomyces invadans]|eukprot:XP_008880943.1 tRNA pseudouridine(55) synthase [Aphanomyces invadans]
MKVNASGFINLHKPSGLTSHDCVAKLRRILKTKSVGHAGTLDPMATGVLPIAVNRATKFIQFLDKSKAYDGTIRFGVTTDSDDITGNILHERPVPWLTKGRVDEELKAFVGQITQRPPMVSAFRKDGERMYNLARAGKIELEDVPLRTVTVDSITTLSFTTHPSFPEATVHIVCSEGTYIRSIARECGERIAHPTSSLQEKSDEVPSYAGATLSMLHRTQSGGFLSSSSTTLDDIAASVKDGTLTLQPIEAALPPSLPIWTIDAPTERRWIGGMSVEWNAGDDSTLINWKRPLQDPGLVSVYRMTDGEFLGVTSLFRTTKADGHFVVSGPRVIVDPLDWRNSK